MLAKQNAAKKLAPSFAPRTAIGLFVRNVAMRLLNTHPLSRHLAKTGLMDAIDLPEYEI